MKIYAKYRWFTVIFPHRLFYVDRMLLSLILRGLDPDQIDERERNLRDIFHTGQSDSNGISLSFRSMIVTSRIDLQTEDN